MTIPEASGLYLPPLARFATLSQPPLAGRPATATIITVEIVRNPRSGGLRCPPEHRGNPDAADRDPDGAMWDLG